MSGTVDELASALLTQLRAWATTLGFSQIGVADVDLSSAEPGLLAWLHNGFHGSMDYMARHGLKRARPAELVPGTVRVITARMDYLPRGLAEGWQAIEWRRIDEPSRAQVSLYARGRDYHKLMRARLQQLADRLADAVGPLGHRVFTDSAPLLEVELASRSGVGWRGKHTLALDREAGSMFFLGEICVDLALPLTPAIEAHCGSCSACIDICPTRAIVAPYRLDARRCISYLTIEHAGPIPQDLRPALGNRIFGCDDCQLVCPWNKFARRSTLADFDSRASIGQATLLGLWQWDEADFLRHTEGSAIRRIGHRRWRRNLAVAMGNALRAEPGADSAGAMLAALGAAREDADELVREHIDWALRQPVT
ncbi:MAG: tRNA epoxyqueuosine(34) reductase QueG [Rhizobacter sp.]|nr:tRNA epoxyqueuosine(34) reductase QueG [Rhizobacter sp.]